MKDPVQLTSDYVYYIIENIERNKPTGVDGLLSMI